MSTQLALKYDPARAVRDEGIQRSAEHADREVPSWNDRAFAQLAVICGRYKSGTEITGESIRKIAEQNGLPMISNKRAWGNIMLRAAKAGIIRKNGWTTAEDPKVHQNPVSKWVIV